MSQSAAEILARSEFEPLEAPRFRTLPYLLEVQSELLQALRQPAFAVPTLLFPAMFYLFFGIVFGQSSNYASYLLATYGAFGVISTALFGFGVSVAISRESGELLLKSVAPVPPFAFLAGKMMTSLVFSCLVLAELFALAALFGNVRFERLEWAALAGVLLVGSIPFAALGLAIGTLASGKGAPAIVNMLFLPMAFLSGLWIPIPALPSALQNFAMALPPYHLAQLALGVFGRSQGQAPALHVLVLVAVTAISVAVAARGLRR